MTETKYYVDKSGVYIGGFEGCDPPKGAVEVPEAPDHAAQPWDFKTKKWGPIPAETEDAP